MPYIDCKFTAKLDEGKKESVKSALGKKIGLMHKPESYLMVGICDGYDLYFAGKKLSNGAFVSVSVFGGLSPADCDKMTAAVCEIFKTELGIDGASIYVTYQGVENWGFNGGNF